MVVRPTLDIFGSPSKDSSNLSSMTNSDLLLQGDKVTKAWVVLTELTGASSSGVKMSSSLQHLLLRLSLSNMFSSIISNKTR